MTDARFDQHPNELFDAFTIECRDAAAQDRVRRQFGADWQFEEVENDPLELDVMPRAGFAPSAEDLGATHAELLATEGVVHVDASFDDEFPELTPPDEDDSARERDAEAGARTDYEWALDMVRARQAWDVPTSNHSKGQGILIGHPDSGYRDHPQLNPAGDNRLALANDRDFIDRDNIPLTADKSGNHGLGTASVIISGIDDPKPAGGYVTGIAPMARLMPLRVAKWKIIGTPVLFGGGLRRLRRAINHAVDQDCHVISISLGSPFSSWSLRKAIRRAVDRGVIVLAAAGNRVGAVTYPARHDEVIAVAACDRETRRWKGSSRGQRVDVTAPGQDVFKAGYRGDLQVVKESSGTSFAVAITAGVAALWLAHWGRDTLIAHYGSPRRMVTEFKQLLQFTCNRNNLLPNNGKWGAGIVDAEKLLQHPVP